MEEKERYEWRYSPKTMEDHMFDNLTKIKIYYENIPNLLNQYEKQIKEVEKGKQELKTYLDKAINDCNKFFEENQQLKQELQEERAELQQLYSHLGVEAFGEDIQEQAVKEIDKIKEENQQLKPLKPQLEELEDGTTICKWTDVEKENQQLRQQLEEKDKENATLEAMLAENANDRKAMQEFKIGENEYDLTDEDARNSLCWEVKELKQQLHDLPKKIVEYFYDEIRHRAILEDDYCPDHNLERKYGVRKCLLENIRTTILKKYGGEDE